MSALVIFRRILNLHQRKFWHSWEVRWSCLYEDVVGFPLLTENALVIKEQSSKVQFLRSLNCFSSFSHGSAQLEEFIEDYFHLIDFDISF